MYQEGVARDAEQGHQSSHLNTGTLPSSVLATGLNKSQEPAESIKSSPLINSSGLKWLHQTRLVADYAAQATISNGTFLIHENL